MAMAVVKNKSHALHVRQVNTLWATAARLHMHQLSAAAHTSLLQNMRIPHLDAACPDHWFASVAIVEDQRWTQQGQKQSWRAQETERETCGQGLLQLRNHGQWSGLA